MKTILVVEDNNDNMDLVKEILEDEGYEVYGTENAENGIEILERGITIDVILMDVSLPKLNGYDATRLIKENNKYKDIPIVMLTAHAMHEDRVKGFDAGCDEFLTKPLDEDVLIQTIERMIQERS